MLVSIHLEMRLVHAMTSLNEDGIDVLDEKTVANFLLFYLSTCDFYCIFLDKFAYEAALNSQNPNDDPTL